MDNSAAQIDPIERLEFIQDDVGTAKGGDGRLQIGGQGISNGQIQARQAMGFPADETYDARHESGAPVSPDYTSATSTFTGITNVVQLDQGMENYGHIDRLRRVPACRNGTPIYRKCDSA
jgi:hypothetical protein